MNTEKTIRDLQHQANYHRGRAEEYRRQLKEARAEIEVLTRTKIRLSQQAARLQAAAITAIGADLNRRIEQRRTS